MSLTAEDKEWFVNQLAGLAAFNVASETEVAEPDTTLLGVPYNGQRIVNELIGGHPINPEGTWWKRAVAKVPTRILFDDVDKAETEREMAVLEVNEDAIEATYNHLGFINRTVIKFPAIDVDGSEIPYLICLPNVNVLQGVRSNYAVMKADEVIQRMLIIAWYKDQAIEREERRLAAEGS